MQKDSSKKSEVLRTRSSEKGLTLAEAVIGLAILIAVFGYTFRNLKEIRGGLKNTFALPAHLTFESFAVSKLRGFYAKLMHWNMHVCKDSVQSYSVIPHHWFQRSDKNPDGRTSNNINCLCSNADYFAYAANDYDSIVAPVWTYPADAPEMFGTIEDRKERANHTLGADLRMALSTFNYNGTRVKSLVDLAAEKREDPSLGPWGALIPFHDEDSWKAANPYSFNYCRLRPPPAGTRAAEMCAQFESCAGKTARPENQIVPTADGFNMRDLKVTSMCFVFAGNLNTDPSTTPTKNDFIDSTVNVSLAVTRARILSHAKFEPLECSKAIHDKNRTIKVKVTFYTTTNVNLREDKQITQKSLREISSEKLGVVIPNCEERNRGIKPSRRVSSDWDGQTRYCIEDPTWNYECATRCDPTTEVSGVVIE